MGKAIASKPATYADLAAVPPHLVAETLFGTLVTQPRPAPKHANAQNALRGELTPPFHRGRGGPGGWLFMSDPELRLGPHVLVSDLAGWRRERLTVMPTTASIDLPPDWIGEVITLSTENYDRGPNRRIYATFDVGHMWFVEPIARRLEAYVLRAGQWILSETFDGADDVVAPPFDAVPFPVAALWPLEPAPDNS